MTRDRQVHFAVASSASRVGIGHLDGHGRVYDRHVISMFEPREPFVVWVAVEVMHNLSPKYVRTIGPGP